MALHSEKINKFQEFCGVSDVGLAARYLNHCGNDVQAAIQLYFQTDGILHEEEEDWDDEIARARSAPNSEGVSRRSQHHGVRHVAREFQSASRSIALNSHAVQPWRHFILAILALPFNFFISTACDILRFFYELIVGERVPTIEDLRRDVANFRNAVIEKFNRTNVEFFDGTFDEAYLAACDSEKVFAAFIFTPGARYSEDIIREILEDENFGKTVNDFSMVLWGADPRSVAGRSAARKMKISTFPSFVALSSRDESVLMRVEMPKNAKDIWPLLRQCALEEIELLEEEAFKRRILRENRELMEQQEKEYRESEERDRAVLAERRRQRELADELEMRRNKEEKKVRDVMAQCQQALNQLRNEITSGNGGNDYNGKDCIRVLVRYPCGATTQHQFSPDESLANLFGVVFSESYCPDYFEAHYGFPRTKLDFYSEKYHNIIMEYRRLLGQETWPYVGPKTFKQLGITSSLTLYISDIDS